MKKYIFLIFLTGFLFSCHPDKKDKSIDQPNVIIILTDDQGYHDVGFNGCTDIPTPNIDRLAQNGVKFTNAYVSYAVCGPSRAGLMTGRYQDRFGFGRNPLFAPNDPVQGLPVTEETLATALDKVGYQTMAFGKWHLGAHESQRPLNRGFDEFYGFLTGGHQYFPELWTLKDISEVKSQYDAYKTKLLQNNTRVDEQEYLTDALSREAVRFIDRNAENPFFLYLAYNAPHTPLQATEKYLNRFLHIDNKKRRTYAAMVSAVDDGVGEILDKLNELGIHDKTLIFFLSDNGGPEKHNGSDNGPLREGKGSLYEGGIRVPFAMQWPGKISSNQVYNHPIISLDIFATVIKYAGAKSAKPLDGINIVPFILGEKQGVPHKHLFWRKFDKNFYAVRSEDMKLVKMKGNADELYNLMDDTEENHKINDDILGQTLLGAWNNWNNQMIEPVFLGLIQNKKYNELNPDRFILEPY